MMGFLRAMLGLLVLFYQSLILALAQVWANKMRSILTTLGIVIGVASVSTVIAALSGLQQSILNELEAFGTNNVFIFPQFPQRGQQRVASWQKIRFTPDLFNDILDHCPSLSMFTRMIQNRVNVSYQQRSEPGVQLYGIEPAWHRIQARPITQGRPFSYIDNDQGRAVCLINNKLIEKIGLPADPTGEFIVFDQKRYLIVGVMEPRVSSGIFAEGGSDSEVFVPFNTLWRASIVRNPFSSHFVIAASKSPDATEEASGEIRFYLRQKRRIQVGEPDTFGVEFVSQFIKQFNAIATGVTAAAGAIVGISLVVGGVGIMNIMLVSVSERTREIGLRKAVGARPSAILLQFLVEAVFLCFLGGLIGLLIAQIATSLIARVESLHLEHAYIPAWAVALSFGFSAAVGLIFGMFPAIKAARLDPIEALRHE